MSPVKSIYERERELDWASREQSGPFPGLFSAEKPACPPEYLRQPVLFAEGFSGS